MDGNNTNDNAVSGSEAPLEQLKFEVTKQLGIPFYTNSRVDKGDIAARVHGKVGGNMTRKMVKFAERAMRDNEDLVRQVAAETIPQHDFEVVQSYFKNALNGIPAVQQSPPPGQMLQ